MCSSPIKILPLSPSITNFQKCIIGCPEIVREIEEKFPKFFQIHLSLALPSRPTRIIVRCCKSNVSDGVRVIQLDLRVEDLSLLLPENPENIAHNNPGHEKGESGKIPWKNLPIPQGSNLKTLPEAGKSFKNIQTKDISPTFAGQTREALLARHLVSKLNGSKVDSCRDVNSEGDFSSVRSNDPVVCTSKDVKMLKSGTIKMMRLTVISDSSLSDFHSQTASTFHTKTIGKHPVPETQPRNAGADKHISKADESLSIDLNLPNAGLPFGSKLKSKTFSKWGSLAEKVRLAFQSYDLFVKDATLIDLRGCPLSSACQPNCPSIAFIFVEECFMRNADADVGRVNAKTEILINYVHHISYYEREVSALEGRTNKLHGLERAVKILNSLITMQQQPGQSRSNASSYTCQNDEDGRVDFEDDLQKYFPHSAWSRNKFYSHGLLICGPSGCGKSLAVRETVKKLRANLVVFSNPKGGGDELGSFCETWTETFIKCVLTRDSPTVLLIPRVDEALLIKQNKSGSFVKKVVNHVCSLFDSLPGNCMLTVVGTTDKPFLIPAKLRRAGRFEREVYIGAPTERERREILGWLSGEIPSLEKLDLDSVARRTPGYVGQDLIRVAHLAILKSYEEDCSEVSDVHIKYALSRILPTVLQGSLGVVGIQRTSSLDHIAGLHSVKLDLIKAIVWPLKYPYAFRTMGITPPKGILLHSPPGCAKTTLVRAVAASHQTNFLAVSAAELFSSGVGDSEKIVADLFHRARMASPCILFIDELEAIVGSRQMAQKREKTTNDSILSMFLTEMDGVGSRNSGLFEANSQATSTSMGPLVLVVAATNRIDLIDSALIRPGRFDKLIYVPPLDEAGRLELLHICSKTIPFDEDVDFVKISCDTEYFTGADIVNLCREAALLSLTENMGALSVSSKHMNKAMHFLGPSLSQ